MAEIIRIYFLIRALKHGGHDTNVHLESFNLVATVMVIIS